MTETNTRPTTARRAFAALGNDRLHKTINWTSLIGVIGTAIFAWLADGGRFQADQAMATGAAKELAVLYAWKEQIDPLLRDQAEQIARLREAVAALKALSRGRGRDARAMVEMAIAEPYQSPDPAPPPAPTPARVDALRDLLLPQQ